MLKYKIRCINNNMHAYNLFVYIIKGEYHIEENIIALV